MTYSLRKVFPSFGSFDMQHWNGDDINNLIDILQGNTSDKIPITAIDKGAADQYLKTNAAGTGLEFADLDVSGADVSTMTGYDLIALLAGAQRFTGVKTFLDGNLYLRNPADTAGVTIKANAQGTDKVFTCPVANSDEFVTKNATQTLAGKTIDAASNTVSNIADANIASHTSTKITITDKTHLNSAIVYNDASGSLGAYYRDIAEIASPANPSAGSRRIYVDSTTHALTVKTSDGNVYTLEGASALPSRSTVGRWGTFMGNNASHIGDGLFRDFTLLGSEGTFTWVNSYGPTIKYSTAASTAAYAGLRTTNQVASSRMNPVLTAKFQTDSNTSDRIKIGFTSSTTLTDAFSSTLNNISGAMVGFDSGSANYSVITNNGGASQVNTTAGMPALTAANSATLVTLQVTGGGTGLTWIIQNGSGITTNSVSSQLPGADTTLYAFCAIQTNTGTAKGLSIEWIDLQLNDRYLF